MTRTKIEFLFWEECPSHQQAYDLLKEAMAATGVTSPIVRIEVLTDEDAARLSFPGSPTIRVDGTDIDPSGAELMGSALTCRVYHLEDGRISPLPSKQMIERALVGSDS